MNDPAGVREALRRWIAEASGRIEPGELADDTPIFRDGILKSVQVTDLILYIEELGRRSMDVERIKPGAFRDIEAICRHFFDHADEPT